MCDGKSICAKAFYAPCESPWECEQGPWQYEEHMQTRFVFSTTC